MSIKYTKPQRQAVRSKIKELRKKHLTYNQIAEDMNENGYARPNGSPLTSVFVSNQYAATTSRARKKRKLKIDVPKQNGESKNVDSEMVALAIIGSGLSVRKKLAVLKLLDVVR